MLLLRYLRSAGGGSIGGAPVLRRLPPGHPNSLARQRHLNNGHAAAASTCSAAAAAAGSATPNPTAHPLDQPTESLAAALLHLRRELGRFDPALPIEQASTPPSSWSVP